MSQATRVRDHPRFPHVTLNSDGRKHPLENALTAFTFVAGIVAFAIGFIVRDHMAGTVLGKDSRNCIGSEQAPCLTSGLR